jgi:hypothetical protein
MAARRPSLLAVALLAAAALVLASAPTSRAVTYKPYSSYLSEVRPMLTQWEGALEAFQGNNFLVTPDASNTADAPALQGLLSQWFAGLENARGTHFLVTPTTAAIDTTSELHSLLNQWQNALEAWRGSHFLSNPPHPYLTLKPPKFTGTFKLQPRAPDVEAGKRHTIEISWTVPKPNNWRDLRTIDLRVCRRDTLLLVRWKELTNELSLLDPRNGRVLDAGVIGERGGLRAPAAVLSLAKSSVEADGPAARKVALGLNLVFRGSAAGVGCDLSLAASDDLGNRDKFKPAGKIQIDA